MRLLERLQLPVLLLLGSVALSPSTWADAIDLKPFKATYTAEWKGITAGTSTLELSRAGADLYSYSSVSTARGMFKLAFSEDLTQTSTFRLHEGQVQPINFRGTDGKQRSISLNFDWEKMRVTGEAKENSVDLELPQAAHDPMSLQISVLRSLTSGEVPPTVWLIDSDKLKEYQLQLEGTARIETALGELDTVIYTSKRAGADRLTRTWVAPALGHLPVRAERIRGKKTEFTLKIASVDR